MGLRLEIESWSPEYGSPHATALEPTETKVDTEIEIPEQAWEPRTPSAALEPARRVVFVDGVRRIEAVVWITDDAIARRGLCASYAAGRVRAADKATIEGVEVRRGLFVGASRTRVPSLATRAGAFEPHLAADDDLDKLHLALQQSLGELEIDVATALDAGRDGVELFVVDGPLSGRRNVPGAVGYVKTHHVGYLPETLTGVVGLLAPGQRTPLFMMRSSWPRYSWYLRLPGTARHPWAGVVRIEASADRGLDEAVELADRTAITLPIYASQPHKDPRAPQNLFPIAGLERELRHRLGDAHFVQRALRLAAATPTEAPRLARRG